MRVLLVEDEPLVRMMGADVLADAGFEVLEAMNADEALGILEAEPDVQILVTDIDMPGSMDGLTLARVAHDRWPQMPVLVISGKVRPSAAELPPGGAFLAKPFPSAKLVGEVRRLSTH
jgi:CheY-like chemotaxis protein